MACHRAQMSATPTISIVLIDTTWFVTIGDDGPYEFDSFDGVVDFVYAMAGGCPCL